MKNGGKILKIYFGIDCAPGTPRPEIYAKRVFEKLGVESVTPYSKCFGAWEWNIELDDTFDFDSFSSWMKSEMDRLYNTGNIRGAQWGKIKE